MLLLNGPLSTNKQCNWSSIALGVVPKTRNDLLLVKFRIKGHIKSSQRNELRKLCQTIVVLQIVN